MVRFKNKFGMSLFYLICTIGIEIITFCMLEIGILPKHFMYDLGLMLMFAGMIFIIPNYLAQYIVSMVIIIAQVVLTYVNYSLYHLYGDVFSFDMIRLFNETKQAITLDFTYIWLIIALVGLVLVVGVVGFFFYKSLRVYRMPFYKNFSAFIVMVLLIVQGLGFSVYTQQSIALSATADINDENYVLSDAFLRDTTMIKIASLKSLGTYGYYVNNIMNLLSNTQSEAVLKQAKSYFEAGDIYDETMSNVFGIDEGNNVLVIMMESLEWYGFSNGTFNSRTFSEELTPNIYSLIQEGVVATDFFSKSKTNISEGIGILGSFPIGKLMGQVASSSTEEYYGFSLPNILKAKGYDTGYYHGYNGSFYDREDTHEYLGFDHLFFGNDALDHKVEWGAFPKEADFVQDAIDYGELIPEGKQFFNFYTSLTTHGAYTDKKSVDNEDRKEYRETEKDTDGTITKQGVRGSNWYNNACDTYSSETQEYLLNYEASVIGLDQAVGVMVQRLKDLGIYDQTTIVLYSDHNAYYHTLSNSIKGVGSSDYSDTELNTVPMIIKSKALSTKIDEMGYRYYNEDGSYDLTQTSNTDGVLACPDKYGNLMANDEPVRSTDRFCSAYDIVPTILDLLGISFNTRLYPGNSLFAELDTKIQVLRDPKNYDPDNPEYVYEYVSIYYSHTGGLFGNYGNTKDMDEFDYTSGARTYVEYEREFPNACKKLLAQLNCVATLYTYGTYQKLDPATLGDAYVSFK